VGEGDLAAQTTQVMQNLGLALKAAGATYANIVKITTFVVNYKPELRPIIGKARSAFFEGMEPPASTLVGVSALAAPEWLIEIEAIAVVTRHELIACDVGLESFESAIISVAGGNSVAPIGPTVKPLDVGAPRGAMQWDVATLWMHSHDGSVRSIRPKSHRRSRRVFVRWS